MAAHWTRRGFLGVAAAAGCSGSAPEVVVDVDTFTEGPVFDYDGNLYFSHGDAVSRLTPDGLLAVWARAEGANGHKVLPDGTHWVCSMGEERVLHFDGSGERLGDAIVASEGEPLRAPNDLTLDAHGGFYFSDPGDSRETPDGNVHYVGADGAVRRVAEEMDIPNGLVLSPDGNTLYVAETIPNRVNAFAVKAPGVLGERRLFAELPARDVEGGLGPDGMAMDSEGNLYVAQLGMGSVQVLTPGGRLLRTLRAGNYDTSNVAFGGEDLDELFVTGSTGHRSDTPGRVYRLHLPGVRGVSSLRPR